MLDRAFIEHYELGADKVSQSISGLTREDMLAFPVPGTWSIQQIVIHLVDSEQVFADRIKRIIAEENATLLVFDENKWTANLKYEEQSAEDATHLISLTRKQISRILKNLPDEAFARTGNHSVTGPITLEEIIKKANGHLEHHLKFILDKREKQGKMMW